MKYWAYVNNEILGPYNKEQLFDIQDFSPATLLCPQTPAGEKTEDWQEAANYPEVAAFLNSPRSALKQETPKDDIPKEEIKTQDQVPAQEETTQTREEPKSDDINPEQEKPSLNQLKPQALTPSSIEEQTDQTKPEPADTFEINKLSPLKKEEQKEPPAQEAQIQSETKISETEDVKAADSRFDPLTLSQIGKKAPQEPMEDSPAPKEPSFQEEEKKEPLQEKSPEIAPAEEQKIPSEDSNIPSQSMSEINAKLEELSQNVISKNDMSAYMEPIDTKLSQIDKTVANLENTKLADEIKEMSNKLKHMEDVIDEIKINISLKQNIQETAPQAEEEPVKEETQTVFSAMDMGKTERVSGDQLQKELDKTGIEPVDESPIEEKTVDDAKDEPKAKKSNMVKKILKAIFTISLIIAVLAVAAIALKKAGIIDITKILPIPFLTESKSLQITELPVQPLLSVKQIPIQQERDLKPEIIFFTKTFSVKNGEKTLENQIIKQAAKEKIDTTLIKWEALKVSEKIYKVNAIAPLPEGFKITYKFEVDYAAKTIKPMNAQGKTAFDNLSEVIKPKKRLPSKKKTVSRKKRKPAPAPKKVVVKEPEPEIDDEYEYIEEEEYDDDEYMLPGMPGFGD